MERGGTAWQALAGRCRFGLIDLIRGTRTVALLRELESLEFAPPAALAARRQSALDAYVARVRAASSLYRHYGAFAQFPIVDKAFANANRAVLRNGAYRGKLVRKKTGGSTGQPFVYVTGVRAQSYLWAAILLSWRVAGYRLGEPVAFLAGSALFGNGLRQRLYYRLMNARLYSAFDLAPERLAAYARSIAATRCRLLYGYASAIHQLALHLLASTERPAFSLRGVVCTAEVLSEPMRAAIEQAFGVPCYSQYGCNDAGVSAYECERRSGFHLVSTRAWHEVLADGRLLATDLANDAFFLPRYDTGDLVRMAGAPCPCGRSFPLIASVIGRANDLVRDAAGHTVHSEFFTHLFREDPDIAAFQVLYDDTELAILVHGARASPRQQGYLERIAAALQFDSIRFVWNKPFICIANGKHRFVMQVDNVAEKTGEAIRCYTAHG
jgi:phenylacetate-CoA ligase